MKYLLIALIAIAVAFGFMIKHSNDKRAALAAEKMAYEQKLEQERIANAKAEATRQIEKQQKAQYYADLAARTKKDYDQSIIEAEKNKVAMIAKKVTDSLIDPSSAQFRNQNGNCGEVNAKNRMGGYIGFEKYIYDPKTDHVIISDKDTSSIVDALWSTACR